MLDLGNLLKRLNFVEIKGKRQRKKIFVEVGKCIRNANKIIKRLIIFLNNEVLNLNTKNPVNSINEIASPALS